MRGMKRVVESFSLPCSVDAFWQVFFDPAYTRSLYLDELKFKDFAVLESRPDSRKLRIVPKVNLPGPIAKLIGDTFAYEEHGTFDRAANLWTWKMVHPGGGKGLLSTSGTIRLTADGAGCRRQDDVTVEGKVFGISGIIESSVEKELHASWAKEIAFLRRRLSQA